jgi:hypothetical protein
MKQIKARNPGILIEDLNNIATHIKDNYAYVADDPHKEFEIFDERIRTKGDADLIKYPSIFGQDQVTNFSD